MSTLPALLTTPLLNLDAWAAHFRDTDIPVLPGTSEGLEVLRANVDAADASSIGQLVIGDPLMTLKWLTYASTHRSARMLTDAETVIGTLLMMGVTPSFARSVRNSLFAID